MNPTLTKILNALLDAAELAFPKFRFLLEYLRPFIMANMPDEGLVVVGSMAVGDEPESIKQMVVDFLTGLMGKTTRPLVKVGLRIMISLSGELVDLIWGSVFPGVPKPLTLGTPGMTFEHAVDLADAEELPIEENLTLKSAEAPERPLPEFPDAPSPFVRPSEIQ